MFKSTGEDNSELLEKVTLSEQSPIDDVLKLNLVTVDGGFIVFNLLTIKVLVLISGIVDWMWSSPQQN